MNKIFSALIGLVILTSTAFSQKIPVEGWLGPGKAKENIECGESWKDSGKRTHYFVCKAPGEITLYGDGFGFKAKQEADWGLSIFDELINDDDLCLVKHDIPCNIKTNLMKWSLLQ